MSSYNILYLYFDDAKVMIISITTNKSHRFFDFLC